jgi:hypothetical protein
MVELASKRTSTRIGLIINKLLSGVAAAAMVVLALTTWAQGVTTQGQPPGRMRRARRALQRPAFPGCPAANRADGKAVRISAEVLRRDDGGVTELSDRYVVR